MFRTALARGVHELRQRRRLFLGGDRPVRIDHDRPVRIHPTDRGAQVRQRDRFGALGLRECRFCRGEGRARLRDDDRILLARGDEALRLIEVTVVALDRRLGDDHEPTLRDRLQVSGLDREPEIELRRAHARVSGDGVEVGGADVEPRHTKIGDLPRRGRRQPGRLLVRIEPAAVERGVTDVARLLRLRRRAERAGERQRRLRRQAGLRDATVGRFGRRLLLAQRRVLLQRELDRALHRQQQLAGLRGLLAGDVRDSGQPLRLLVRARTGARGRRRRIAGATASGRRRRRRRGDTGLRERDARRDDKDARQTD